MDYCFSHFRFVLFLIVKYISFCCTSKTFLFYIFIHLILTCIACYLFKEIAQHLVFIFKLNIKWQNITIYLSEILLHNISCYYIIVNSVYIQVNKKKNKNILIDWSLLHLNVYQFDNIVTIFNYDKDIILLKEEGENNDDW